MQPHSKKIHHEVVEKIQNNKHILMGYLFLSLVFTGAISSVYYWQNKSGGRAAVASDPSRHVESGEQYEVSGLYTDNHLGYELSYNSELEVTKLDNGISLGYPDSKWMYAVEVVPNVKNLTLKQLFEQEVKIFKDAYLKGSNPENMSIDVSDLKVKGIDAKQVVINNFGDVGNVRVYILKDAYVYSLIASDGEWVNEEGGIEQLTKNFRFIK